MRPKDGELSMTDKDHGVSAGGEVREWAFDPVRDPALFEGIRRRRVYAFLIDAVSIVVLTIVLGVAVLVLGFFTFGLGWVFYTFLWQAVALTYTALTLGGPHSATPGMRAMEIEMRLWYGPPMDPVLAAIHALGFWISQVVLTPMVLAVSLFSDRKRCLHDIVLGTVVINAEPGRG